MKILKSLVIALPLFSINQFIHADWIKSEALNNEKQTIQIRQHIHQNPELGNIEFNTSALVQKELASYGIEVKKGFAKTGVIGILKGNLPGPVMALRADMDALPLEEQTGLSFASTAKSTYQGKSVSVMHACGHDAHTAMLLGAAKILAKNKDKIQGTVVFVFQPAEEGPADLDPITQNGQYGSRQMIKDGALSNPKPETMFAIHMGAGASGNIFYKEGTMLNSGDSLQIKLIGKSAHGSRPWLSQDPITASAEVISNLQTLMSRRIDLTKGLGIVTLGSIHGGTASNIIPEEVNITGTIRTNNESIRQEILKSLPVMVEHAAMANNVKAKVDISTYAPVTSNNSALTKALAASLEKTTGADKLHILDVNSSGSEDFAFYGELIPTLFVYLGATPLDQDPKLAAPVHNPKFIVDNATLKTGVEAHVRFIMDYPAQASTVQSQWKSKS